VERIGDNYRGDLGPMRRHRFFAVVFVSCSLTGLAMVHGQGPDGHRDPREGGRHGHGGRYHDQSPDTALLAGDLHIHSSHSAERADYFADSMRHAAEHGLSWWATAEHDVKIESDPDGNLWTDPV